VNEKCRARSVAGHYAGALLPAVLERKKSVVSQHRRVRMTEHAEESAFVVRKSFGLGWLDDVDPSSRRIFGVVWRNHTK